MVGCSGFTLSLFLLHGEDGFSPSFFPEIDFFNRSFVFERAGCISGQLTDNIDDGYSRAPSPKRNLKYLCAEMNHVSFDFLARALNIFSLKELFDWLVTSSVGQNLNVCIDEANRQALERSSIHRVQIFGSSST